MNKITTTFILILITTAQTKANDGHHDAFKTIILDEVSVHAQENKKEHKLFEKAGSVSSIHEKQIEESVTGLDSVIRALPGTFTYMDTNQGTLQVNVRGMTGFGRVNTLIDGVPQTLFGITASSEDDKGFHEGGAGTSSTFGAVIDPNFLVGADIHRGGMVGAGGINALMGNANFRTLDVEDVLTNEQHFGGQIKYSHGNNKLGSNAMIALATKIPMSQGKLGAVLALSGANKGTDYQRGDGKSASSNTYAVSNVQKPRSYLAKINYQNDNHKTTLSVRDYDLNSGGRVLSSQSYGLDYRYAPSQTDLSNWIDLSFLANMTINEQTLNPSAKYFQLDKAKSINRSSLIDVNNTSYFYPKFADISTTIGVSLQQNDYQRQVQGQNNDNEIHTPFAPTGKQTILGYYMNNTLEKGRYTLDWSVGHTQSKFNGFKPACGEVGGIVVRCFPQGEATINKKDNKTQAKIQLSAHINDWFRPFISHAQTSRMPNIQEVFFNNEGGGSMNPFLRPEVAKTNEIGFNTLKTGVFKDNDTLGIKAVHFNSRIDDYIHVQSFYLKEDGNLSNNINDANASFHAKLAVNSVKPVYSHGYELTANYTASPIFGTLSFTRIQSDQPVDSHSGHSDFGFSGGATSRLPESYWTLNVGTKGFNDKLQLATTLKYYGKNVRLRPDGLQSNDGVTTYKLQTLPTTPIITDLNMSYQFNKNTSVYLGVENVFDKLYIHPLNRQNSNNEQYGEDGESFLFNNYARGRTVKIGANLRF